MIPALQQADRRFLLRRITGRKRRVHADPAKAQSAPGNVDRVQIGIAAIGFFPVIMAMPMIVAMARRMLLLPFRLWLLRRRGRRFLRCRCFRNTTDGATVTPFQRLDVAAQDIDQLVFLSVALEKIANGLLQQTNTLVRRLGQGGPPTEYGKNHIHANHSDANRPEGPSKPSFQTLEARHRSHFRYVILSLFG